MHSIYYKLILLKSLSLILFLLLSIHLSSQIEHIERIEINLEKVYAGYSLLSVGNDGLVIIGKPDKNTKKTEVIKYNTDFRKVLNKEIKLEKNLLFKEQYFDKKNNAYFLFSNYKKGRYHLIHFNTQTNEIRNISGQIVKKFEIDGIKVFADKLYISGYYKGGAALIRTDLTTKRNTFIPVNYKGINHIENIQYLESSNRLFVVISNYHKKLGSLFIKTFHGNELEEVFSLLTRDGKNLIDARISSFGKDDYVLIGTYAAKKNQVTGMFITRIQDGKRIFIKYHNFIDFNHFFDHVSEKYRQKIEKKAAKKESKGKELNLSYSMVANDLIPRGDNYLMIAEAYYTTYRTESYWEDVMINGVIQQVRRTRSVFDGYQFTHAVIAEFNKQGELIWDNSFELGHIKSWSLEPNIEINIQKDTLKMLYATDFYIISKGIVGDKIIDVRESERIQTANESDKIKYSDTHSEYWYDDYFLIWGIQKIKNKEAEKGDKKKRWVFFFNKLGLE